jgi:protein gp37
MKDSKIEWTDHTANLWIGCTEVHAGCDNCYARVLNNRWGHKNWGNDQPRRMVKKVWSDLIKWQKEAAAQSVVKRVFVGSMMDIFEKPMPLILSDGTIPNMDTDLIRRMLFERISNNHFPNLLFLLLTKRPSNINKYIPESWKLNPPSNVMFGTSPVNQETANILIPQLSQVKGWKFLSVEPQLGEISFLPFQKFNPPTSEGFNVFTPFHWVIQGGESGHHRRPFDLSWAHSLKKQCEVAHVPYFFKQIDKIKPIPPELLIRQFPII